MIFFFIYNRSTENIPDQGAEFEIKKGDSARSIAERLYIAGYIRSNELFVIIVKILKLDRSLKTGWIELKPGATTLGVIKSIYSGNFITISFTFPEGETLENLKQILIRKNIVTSDDLEAFFSHHNYLQEIGLNEYKNIEGFLFPETYKFFKGVDTKTILSSMIKLFFKKLSEIYPAYTNLSPHELYNKIVMASIIEKEVKLPEEANIVAGVFYNRLKIGMKIQSCATVQYVLGKPKEQLLETDLFIDNPYNTYIYKGLPPGAIGNPGLNALKAAFKPAKHDYIFFVVSDPEKGSHHFSVTYEDHLQAKAKYKEIKGFF